MWPDFDVRQTVVELEYPRTAPNTLDYEDDADENERSEAWAKLDIKRRDFAIVQGFIRGY